MCGINGTHAFAWIRPIATRSCIRRRRGSASATTWLDDRQRLQPFTILLCANWHIQHTHTKRQTQPSNEHLDISLTCFSRQTNWIHFDLVYFIYLSPSTKYTFFLFYTPPRCRRTCRVIVLHLLPSSIVCLLIDLHTHTHTHTHKYIFKHCGTTHQCRRKDHLLLMATELIK